MKPQHSYHRHELDYRHGLKNAGSLAIAVTSGGTSGYEKSAEPMQEKLYQVTASYATAFPMLYLLAQILGTILTNVSPRMMVL
ncbi:hypothetical protein PI124_g16991 [Phytophthora idaei]|nr:hypothetical protein PI125_g22421 [Phytophthora idaei]KAG3238032.1 hypothetical protein PI124_g16991 [Phytophthora idaei]